MADDVRHADNLRAFFDGDDFRAVLEQRGQVDRLPQLASQGAHHGRCLFEQPDQEAAGNDGPNFGDQIVLAGFLLREVSAGLQCAQ
jgi:hypothetical protein